MDYNEFVTALVTILNVADTSGTAAFNSVIDRCIAYSELRLQRQFDFLATRAVDLSQQTVGGNRAVAIPLTFVVLEGVSLITPASTRPSQSGGTRVPLQRTTRQFLDLIWPVESQAETPDAFRGGYWALFSMDQAAPASGTADEPDALPSAIIIAPTPDNTYVVEQIGTRRQTPLSAANTTTFMSTHLEDIFLAAALKWGFAYQRDFGAAINNPQAAQSWESEYQALARDLDVETLRQKALIGGFSPETPAATPLPPPPAMAR